MEKTKSLDLGCGPIIRNPYEADLVFGIDLVGKETHNLKIADLTIRPIPFKDSTFDFVTAYDFLEHVPRLLYFKKKRIQYSQFLFCPYGDYRTKISFLKGFGRFNFVST